MRIYSRTPLEWPAYPVTPRDGGGEGSVAVISLGAIRVEAFEKLKKMIVDAEEDILKFDGGNKAAGTRVRKSMQDIKAAAQEIREKVLEVRDAPKPS